MFDFFKKDPNKKSAKRILRGIKHQAVLFHSEIEKRFQENSNFNLELFFLIKCAVKYLDKINKKDIGEILFSFFMSEQEKTFKMTARYENMTNGDIEKYVEDMGEIIFKAQISFNSALNNRFKKGAREVIVSQIVNKFYPGEFYRVNNELLNDRDNIKYIYTIIKNIEELVEDRIPANF